MAGAEQFGGKVNGRHIAQHALAQGYLLEETTMELYWRLYRADGLSPDDPRVAPLRRDDLGRLPRTHIHGGEYDPLKDEGREFAERLRREGVAVRHVEHAGMIHHYYGLGGLIAAARRALTAAGEDLRGAFTA